MSKWLRANGPSLLMLTFIFLLALFIRSYFAYETSAENGYIVSGGSDSYYWMRLVDYHVETGQNLYKDPLLNYPYGLVNPRPPLYSMSVAIPAVLAESLFSSVEDATGFFLVWSTAFWGALTVIPVYFLGRETFGRRAGLAAAFFFAIVPAHVQRSVLSNADHDAFILFLIVVVFYFLLKAVKAQEHKSWVKNWKSREDIVAGVRDYFSSSHKPLLYALMAGTAYAALMMTWVGFAYVTVIILVYYLIELIINMLRNQDSMGVTVILTVAMGFGYLLAFPYYANYFESFFNDRFLVPFLLTAGAVLFGMMFIVSRDYPWTLSLPAIAAVSAVALVVVSVVYPWLGEAILTGQGYFAESKLYATIAEARAPQFSELATSFGMVTFFLALAGLVYAMLKIPKRASASYIFIVVWLGASIFMAISAGRFMFNAAPAFAIAAAWVLVFIVDALDFNAVRKSMAGASGAMRTVLKKSIKVRHVVGVLFLAFLVVLPNVWFSMDAGIPAETKRSYDREIYLSMPGFLRPSGYDLINGSNWYLGAFGYSLPLQSYYYPAAWSWFAEQDAEVYPVSAKPAYVAWWDYGFEAVAAGKHPTVADNFQNGYQFTGNVIMSQSEKDTVALFAYRLIEVALTGGGQVESDVVSVLERHGVDTARMYEIVSGPGQPLIDEVLSDPDEYGPMSHDMTAPNARIVAGRVELAKADMPSLVGLYAELCEVTGWEIRYFNADSRMFPVSGYETGIFYAPAKLSDRRMDGSIPIDFFKIKAVDDRGIEYDLSEITPYTYVVEYKLVYQDMFYDSMFYKAMCGLVPSEIGLTNDGLPGVSGVVQMQDSMPGWNMTNFRVVYRTAYYNPYPAEEVPFNSQAWRAITYDEAKELRAKISSGEATGVVDDSSGSLYRSGTVFLKYYHGAYVNGTVTTEDGYPVPDMWVTVQDEYGIPHHQVKTDSEGRYSLLAPFGNVTVIISSGHAQNPGLTGSNTVTRMKFHVTDDQAMRVKQDLDGDGIFDYIITKDHVMKDSEVYGDLYWDLDMDGNNTSGVDEMILGATVYVVETSSGLTFTSLAEEGSYEIQVPPGTYDVYALFMGANHTVAESKAVTPAGIARADFALAPGMVSGYLLHPDLSPAAGVTLILDDVLSDAMFTAVTGVDGRYTFTNLFGSKYVMRTSSEGKMVYDERFTVDATFPQQRNITLWDSRSLSFRAILDGSSTPYAVYVVTDDYNRRSVVSGLTDRLGRMSLELPPGHYTLRVVHHTGTGAYAALLPIDLTSSDSSFSLPLSEAHYVTGGLTGAGGQVLRGEAVAFVSGSGARAWAIADNVGNFDVVLPKGEYEVVSNVPLANGGVYGAPLSLDSDMIGMQVRLSSGVRISGTLYADANSNLEPDPSEKMPFGDICVTDPDGYVYKVKSSSDGRFSVMFPKGRAVTVTLSDPAYSQWSRTLLYGSDIEDTAFVALADKVQVTGRLTCSGAGVGGVGISFVPDSRTLQTVEAVTGFRGYYSASVAPAGYTVVVDHAVANEPGAWYLYDSPLQVAPSATDLRTDIDVDLKVLVEGSVLGAADELMLQFTGPEIARIELTGFTYSLFLKPGTYFVYATGKIGTTWYASVDSVEVSSDNRILDIQLERASQVSGSIYVGTAVTNKPVTVIATSEEGVKVTNVSTRLGQYTLTLPQGRYALSFLLEDVVHEGDKSTYVELWAERIVTVSPGDVRLDQTLSTRLDNATVSGTVVDENGNPVTATLALVPNGRYGMYASFMTDSSGAFSAYVQPGDYTVHVTRSVDKRVSLTYMNVQRNTGAVHEVQMSMGQHLQGRQTVAGQPSSEEVSVSSGDTRLVATPYSDGYFSFLVPSGDYIVSSDAVRTENDMTVAYSAMRNVEVKSTSVYLDFALLRDTKRSVKAVWDDGRAMTAAPGQTFSYVFAVENTGNTADTYTVSYAGTDFTVDLSPEKVSLGFGSDIRTAYVVAEITVGPTAESGNNTIKVSVRSDNQTSVRAEVSMVVNVSAVRTVVVQSLDVPDPVANRTAATRFVVNNTGNVEDEFVLSVTNLEQLASSGWTASLVDPETGAAVTNVTVGAFDTRELAVQFTAIRTLPDPKAEAVVLAASRSTGGANALGSIPVLLPDLSIGPGDLDIVRDDVSMSYDVGRIYMNIGLVVALVAMIIMFFVIRKRKGLGGGGKR